MSSVSDLVDNIPLGNSSDDSYIVKYEDNHYKNIIHIFKQFIYYSPLILTIIVVMIGFVFQTYVILIYLGAIIVFAAIRNYLIIPIANHYVNFKDKFNLFQSKLQSQGKKRSTYCNIYDYNKTGTGFVIFYATFTIVYILLPMIMFSTYNFYIFAPLLIYLLFICIYNVFIDYCVDMFMASFEFIYGLTTALLVVLSVSYSGNDKLLLLSPLDPNSNFCSMPNNQTFKCSVYKNGELVSSSLSS